MLSLSLPVSRFLPHRQGLFDFRFTSVKIRRIVSLWTRRNETYSRRSAVFQTDIVGALFMGALRRRLKPAATTLQLRATGSH